MRVHRNCCGLDVHKKMIAACVITEGADGKSVSAKRLFGTMTQDLRELAQWLCELEVTAVAMEATGVYWMPVWNVLEQYGLQLLLINTASRPIRCHPAHEGTSSREGLSYVTLSALGTLLEAEPSAAKAGILRRPERRG